MDNLPSNLGNIPQKPLQNNQSPLPPRPIPPPIPPQPTPPPPPPTRDFNHVASITPQRSAQTPLPQTEIKTPPPPGPEIRIRSLQTDTETLAASGGATAEAKTIRLDELDNEPSAFAPETIAQSPDGTNEAPSRARLFMIIGVSISGIVILSLAGYYLAYPLFFAAPKLPLVEEESITEVPTPRVLPHVSLFQTPLPSQAQLNLPEVSRDAIRAAVERELLGHPAPHVMDEMAILVNGGQVPFADFISALIPEFSAEEVKRLIADDFSGFAYFDSNGHWPGYVAELQPSAIPSEVQSVFARLESSNLASFYVNDPGAKGEFKSGQVHGIPTRYAVFSQPGASFNYGIFGNYLVISTSFDGLKAILPYLGI